MAFVNNEILQKKKFNLRVNVLKISRSMKNDNSSNSGMFQVSIQYLSIYRYNLRLVTQHPYSGSQPVFRVKQDVCCELVVST